MIVDPGSPADRAGNQGSRRAPGGILLGDVLLSADGRKVANTDDLYAVQEKHAPGEQITLKLYRDGETRDAKVTLEAPKE
jgi:S1-C subfamily serine protease